MHAVVHLELHTRALPAASEYYARLLDWRPERVETEHGCYVALGLGESIEGGGVQCGTERPMWLPYVEVDQIDAIIERGRELGASVLLGPREGPAGWRCVLS